MFLIHKYLDELFKPWIRAEVIDVYRASAKKSVPVYSKKEFSALFAKVGYEFLLLPFSDGGEKVAAFVSCVFPLDMSMVKFEDWENYIVEIEDQWEF